MTAALGGRLVLACVFVVASLAKFVDPRGSRKTVADFGVPAGLVTLLSLGLPAAELAVGAALIPTSSARWAAGAALALLALFSIAIAINLVRGKQPDCHCFGQLHSAPIGASTLLRNGALAAIAVMVVASGRGESDPSLTNWLGRLSVGQWGALLASAVAAVLITVLGWFVLHLLRQHGRVLVRLDALEAANGARSAVAVQTDGAAAGQGLPVGGEAPDFSLPGLYGETRTLVALRSEAKPVMLLFTDPGCGPCEALMPDVGRWQHDHADSMTVGVISTGRADAVRAVATKHGLRNVLRQEAHEVAERYHYLGTPSAVVVSPEGRIVTPLVAGPDAIRSLFSHTLNARNDAPAWLDHPNGAEHGSHHHGALGQSTVGQTAPSVHLLDLSGTTRDTSEFFDVETLVLFWNPACGYCGQMLPDVKAWEADPPEGSPRLLVVSGGSVEANQAMGLRSPVLLDTTSEAMKAFGADGTPMAVLVDARGKIASSLAVGMSEVLALAAGGSQAHSHGGEWTRNG